MTGKGSHFIFFALLIIAGCHQRSDKREARGSHDFRAGEYYDYYERQDSAFYYYNRVVQQSVDSIEKATAFFKMGLWQLEAGDYYSAQESFLSSIKTLNEKDTAHYRNLAADYNSLANATLNLNDYPSAIRDYYHGLNFVADPTSRLQILNNIGVTYHKQKNYHEAIAVFDSALAMNVTDTVLKARLITNLAIAKWMADPKYFARPELMNGLALRTSINDSLGINSSFAHLSEYYTSTSPDSALHYALKRLAIAQLLDDPNDRLEALNQLIKVGPPTDTKRYAEQYLTLNDSLSNVHSRDRNQYVLIRFDAEKSKAENLLLEKHIITQRLINATTILIAAVLMVTLVVWARVRRKRLKMESEKAIQESQLKTSQKVHDVVANGLYRIMNELEHIEGIQKEYLLDKVEELYEKSRDISYEPPLAMTSDHQRQMHQLLDSFANEHTQVISVGNEQAFWNRLTKEQKREIAMVVEELLVNMQKHSKAQTVVVCFEQQDDKAFVEYKDDGIGFGSGQLFGNGLNSTVNRIKSINGQVNFGKSGGHGSIISISFPLELFQS